MTLIITVISWHVALYADSMQRREVTLEWMPAGTHSRSKADRLYSISRHYNRKVIRAGLPVYVMKTHYPTSSRLPSFVAGRCVFRYIGAQGTS